MSDVLERLRNADAGACYNTTSCKFSCLIEDAADEIASLRAQLAACKSDCATLAAITSEAPGVTVGFWPNGDDSIEVKDCKVANTKETLT